MLNSKKFLPKASILNKPLLLSILAFIVIILLWILVSSLQSKPERKNNLLSQREESANTELQVSPVIAQLPQGYQDVATIKKYLNPVPPIPPEVTQEIGDLRSQTEALQAQLTAMQSHPTLPVTLPEPVVDQGSLDAEKSNIFFSSETPDSSFFIQKNQDKSSGDDTSNTNVSDGVSNSYNQQNMQGQKEDFLNNQEKTQDIYNPYKLIKPVSPYEIQAGTLISASLLTAINTSLPGSVVAQVRQDIYDSITGNYLLIPRGSKLLGHYDSKVAYGQQRILIVYNRIIRPDGTSIQLSNFVGSDQTGESGFAANVDNHWGKILGAATISTMLSFGAGVAADGSSGKNAYYPSAQQNAVLGAAGNISQVGQSLTNRAIDIQPTLTVPAGFNFNIIVNKDLVLSPFKEDA